MSAPALPDSAAHCWICLDGPGESGTPLVRDCSCRGSAGYSHQACLVEYATKNSTAAKEGSASALCAKIDNLWTLCPNCLMPHQGELAVALADSYIAFVDEALSDMGGYNVFHVHALRAKVEACRSMTNCGSGSQEGREAASGILSIVKDVREHSPGSDIPHVIEMEALLALAGFCDGSELGMKMALRYTEKARDVCQKAGDTASAENLERLITGIRLKTDGGDVASSDNRSDLLKLAQDRYQGAVETWGLDHHTTLLSALNVGLYLKQSYHGVEAERWLEKLVVRARQVCGPEHGLTQKVQSDLKETRRRFVALAVPGEEHAKFEVISYEEGGDEYVLQALSKDDDGRSATVTVAVDHPGLLLYKSIPVVCHSLEVDDEHFQLNGKLGEVRGFIGNTTDEMQYEVHFEDQSLQPAVVSKANVRVVADLPPLEAGDDGI